MPQLRSYLRPAGIRNATFKQWEDLLPPYEPRPSARKGSDGKLLEKTISLEERWASYEANRRNKDSGSLKRISLLETDASTLGLDDVPTETVQLANDRTLKSVVNVLPASADSKSRALASQRAEWLRNLSKASIVAVKPDPDAAPAAGTPATAPPAASNTDKSEHAPTSDPNPAGPNTPATAVDIAAAIAAALAAQQATGTPPPAPSFGGANRARQRKPRSSSLVGPTPPSGKPPSQLNSTKPTPSDAKSSAAKSRSQQANLANPADSANSSDPKDSTKHPKSKKQPPPPPIAEPPMERRRATWNKVYEEGSNEVFADEPAYVKPLNHELPLTVRPSPRAQIVRPALAARSTRFSPPASTRLTPPRPTTPPAQGTDQDIGRFFVIPISMYPLLKQPPRNGAEHVGWSVKVTKVVKKEPAANTEITFKEKGQTPTIMTLHDAQQLPLLSV